MAVEKAVATASAGAEVSGEDGNAVAKAQRSAMVDAMVSQLTAALNASTSAEMRGALMGADTSDATVAAIAALVSGTSDAKLTVEAQVVVEQLKQLSPSNDEIKASVERAKAAQPSEQAPSTAEAVAVPGAAAGVSEGEGAKAFAAIDSSTKVTSEGIKTQDTSVAGAGTEATQTGTTNVTNITNNMPVANSEATATTAKFNVGPRISDQAAEMLARVAPAKDGAAQKAALEQAGIFPASGGKSIA